MNNIDKQIECANPVISGQRADLRIETDMTECRNEPSPDGSLRQKTGSSCGTVTHTTSSKNILTTWMYKLHLNSKQLTSFVMSVKSSVSVVCDDNAGWHPQADAGRCSGRSSLENLTSAASTQREPLADQSQSRRATIDVPAANQNAAWACPVTLGMYHCVVSTGDGV